MKKKEPVVAPGSDDILDFEDWEEAVKAEPGEEERLLNEPIGQHIDEPPPLPSKTAEKSKTTRSPKVEPPPVTAKKEVPVEESPAEDEVLKMTADVPVHLVAVIGRTTISVKDMMNFQLGHVIDLGRPPGETVDLVASGKLFARGELVDIDGKLGVRIVKIIK